MLCEDREYVCFVRIGKSDNLQGSVYMNCEGVRKEENILNLEYIKEVVWRAMKDGLRIMIGGDDECTYLGSGWLGE